MHVSIIFCSIIFCAFLRVPPRATIKEDDSVSVFWVEVVLKRKNLMRIQFSLFVYLYGSICHDTKSIIKKIETFYVHTIIPLTVTSFKMASRKGMQQLKNAEMRNAPYMKSVKLEKELHQMQEDKEKIRKKMYEKWLMQARKASAEEKKRMMKEYEEDCARIAMEWRHT